MKLRRFNLDPRAYDGPVRIEGVTVTALLGLPEGMEWVVLLVVAMLLFGGSRVAGMGKGAGRAIREFREELKAPTGIEPPKTDEAEDFSDPVAAEIVTETGKVT